MFLLLFLFDIPPGPEPSSLSWLDILFGAVFAFLGALLFVWLGRRFLKKR